MTWLIVTILGLIALYQLHLIYNELSKINDNIIEVCTQLQNLKDKLANINACVWDLSNEVAKLIVAKTNKLKQADTKSRAKRKN